MLRTLVAILVVLALGAASAGAYWYFVMVPAAQSAAAGGAGRGGPGGPVPVEAQPVRVGTAETTIDAVGSLASNESVVIRPEVAGRVTAINFQEGSLVAARTLLIELDSSIERAELTQAEAQRDLAQSNFERAKELRRNNVGTQRALDEADSALRTAQAQVELTQAQLDKRILVAPFTGTAGLRKVSPGEFVSAGTAIVNLEQLDPLKVDFMVPEIFLPAVAHGQRIALTIDAFPERSFTGVVKAIDPLIDKGGRSIVVRAEIGNGDGALRPGLFVRVRLTLAERENALFVPEQTIQPQGDRVFVYKVAAGEDGKPVARLTQVELGARRRGEVEVRKGLAPGDSVITAGLLKIRDGVPIKPEAPPAPPTAQDGKGPAPAEAKG
ncbi:MAG: efflux RND transporter periplasmic adaptor subunit [Geminicoccaceae bacterium]